MNEGIELYTVKMTGRHSRFFFKKYQNHNPARWSDFIERPHVPNARDFDCMKSTSVNNACKREPSSPAAN